MIIKIVCAGSDTFSKLYHHDESEYLIGVDGGAHTLIKNHLDIDLAIGDFDSGAINIIRNKSKEVVIYHPQKDKSDLELALLYIFNKDFKVDFIVNKTIEKIIIYNATGKRMDHYQAALNLLVRYTHLPMEIVDNHNLIYVVNSKTVFHKGPYHYISFYAVDDNTIISLTGFKYELQNYDFKLFDNLCLSNEIINDTALLETNNKKILVIQSN